MPSFSCLCRSHKHETRLFVDKNSLQCSAAVINVKLWLTEACTVMHWTLNPAVTNQYCVGLPVLAREPVLCMQNHWMLASLDNTDVCVYRVCGRWFSHRRWFTVWCRDSVLAVFINMSLSRLSASAVTGLRMLHQVSHTAGEMISQSHWQSQCCDKSTCGPISCRMGTICFLAAWHERL